MIVIFTRHGDRIEVANGAAVTFAPLPAHEGETPATVLQVVSTTGTVLAAFRKKELAGWDLSAAGADARTAESGRRA